MCGAEQLIEEVPLTPPNCAVICVVPGRAQERTPVPLTLAIAGTLLFHTIEPNALVVVPLS